MKRPDWTEADVEALAKKAVITGAGAALLASEDLAKASPTIATLLVAYAAHRQSHRGLRLTATAEISRVFDRIDAIQDETGHAIGTDWKA